MSQRVDNGAGRNNRSATSSGRGQGSNTSGGRVARGVAGQSQTRGHVKSQAYGRPHDNQLEGPPGRSPEGGSHVHATNNSHAQSPYASPVSAGPNGAAGGIPQHHRSGSAAGAPTFGPAGGGAIMFGSLDFHEVALPNGQLGSPIVQGPGVVPPHWNASHGQPQLSQAQGGQYSNGSSGAYSSSPLQVAPGHSHVGMSGPQGMGSGPPATLPTPGPQQHVTPAKSQSNRPPYGGQQGRYNEQQMYGQPPGLQAQPQYYQTYSSPGYGPHMGGAPPPFPGPGGQHSQGPPFGVPTYDQPRKSSKLKIVDPNTGKEVLPDQRRGSDRPATAVPAGGSPSVPQQAFNHSTHHVGPGSHMGGGPPPSALISDMHQNQYQMQQAAPRQGPRAPPGLALQVHALPPQSMGGYMIQAHAMPNMPYYGNPPSEEIQELARGGQNRRQQQGQASGPVPYANTAGDASYGKTAGPNSRTNIMPGASNVQPIMPHGTVQHMRGPPPSYRMSHGPPGSHDRGASLNPDGRTADPHFKPPQGSTGRARSGRGGHQGGRGGVPLHNQSGPVSANVDAKRGNSVGPAGRQMPPHILAPQARDKKEKEGKLTQTLASEEAAAEATGQREDQAAKPSAAADASQPVPIEGTDAETKQHPEGQVAVEPKAAPDAADAVEQLVAETAPAEAKPQVEDQLAELKPAEGGAEVAVNPEAEEAAPAAKPQDHAGEAKTADAGDGLVAEAAVVEDQPVELKQDTEPPEVAQSLAAEEAAAEAKRQAEEAARQAEEDAAKKEAAEAAEKLAAEEAAAEAKRQAEAAELKAAADAERLKAEEAAAEEKRQDEAKAAKAKEEAEEEEKRQAEAQLAKLRDEREAKLKKEAAAAAAAAAAEELRQAQDQAAELEAAAAAVAEMEKKEEEERAQKAKEEAEQAEAEAARKESLREQEAEKEAAAAASSTAKDQADQEAEKAAVPETEGAPPAHEVDDRPADEVKTVVAADSNGQAPRELTSHAVPLEDEDTDDAPTSGKAAPVVGSKARRKAALAKADTRPATGDLLDAFSEGPKPAAEPIPTPAPDAGPTTPSSKPAAIASPVARESTRSGVEDDWESAAIGTPDASRPVQPAAAATAAPIPSGRLTYTKDFLMLYKDKCTLRPPGLTDKGLGELDVGSTGGREPPGARPGPPFDRPGPPGRGPPGGGRGGMAVEDGWKRQGPPMPPYGAHIQSHGGGRGGMGAHMGPPAPGRGGLDNDKWQKAPLPPPPGMHGGGGYGAPRLHKATDRFVRGYVPGSPEEAEETKRQKEIKGLLNKITPEKFDRIRDQLLAIDFSNPGTLRGLIDQVFDKALGEPTFCEIYAQLCFDLSKELPVFPAIPPNEETGDPGREEMTFRRELLNKCQIEFEEGAAAFLAVARREKAEAEAQLEEDKEEGEINVEDAAAKKLLEHKAAEAERKARMRALGNIQFIGQLYKKRMLIEKIMHECIKSLLMEHEKPKAEEIECLCKLLTTIGIQIDNVKAKDKMDVYFRRIAQMSTNKELESRHRFMLRDLIELRASNWQVRRKIEGPKTIDEIHRDARDEAMQQAARAAAPMDRRGDRDRDRRGLIDARPTMRAERPRFDTVDGPIRAMARAPSQDFGASLRPGGAGGKFPEVSLRPGAGPSAAGRPQSNPRAGTPPKDVAGPAVAPASSASPMSEKDVKQELTALLTEFFSARDQQAVDGRIAELVEKRADFGVVVTTLFSNAITTKGLDAGKVEAFVKMMAQMGSTKDSPAPRADLGKGLLVTIREHLTEFLEDNPRHACPMVGEVAGAWIAADIITLEQVATATLEAGASDEPEEEPELKGSGKAIDFMFHVLKQVAMGRGSEGVAALWKATGHKIEEFVAEVDKDTAADIVKKQATEFGLEALL